jgi:hypothetical protein
MTQLQLNFLIIIISLKWLIVDEMLGVILDAVKFKLKIKK